MAADKREHTGNRFWAPLAVEYSEYIPLQAGSIDGTDTVPHDHGIVRAMAAKCKPLLWCEMSLIEFLPGNFTLV